MFDIDDYDYELPQHLIAQVPSPERDGSRLLVLERATKRCSSRIFRELPGLLSEGDVLVVNDTRVVPSRLYGRKQSGGRVEILVLEHPESDRGGTWERWCLIRASKRPQTGSLLFFGSETTGEVLEADEQGRSRIRFSGPEPIDAVLRRRGHMPLPPYIRRDADNTYERVDRERYQTVYSKREGAIAAPTAGLHFTDALIEGLRARGILLVALTLHVGYGTFRPVRTRDIRSHDVGEESYHVPEETAMAISKAKGERRRVLAVGTTVVRALESSCGEDGAVRPGCGRTNLLVTPGFRFRVVDGMITNFHLPRSSLMFLVAAFAGVETIRETYRAAIGEGYRFYSYGDAMLIL
jgi:S-adenosylmethionine:tRNA ribosyltransferase-isomerase